MSRRLGVFRRLAALYARMQREYDRTAAQVPGFTCAGCPQNCCTSYFQHHTYVEWAYAWQGLEALPAGRRDAFLARARDYLDQARAALGRGEIPSAMCPLITQEGEEGGGRCGLYSHRLMICRLHGVPHVLATPGRPSREYPGCWRYTGLTANAPAPLRLDRTPLYRELAGLERDFLGPRAGRLPRVDLTLAEMLVQGPPSL